MRGRETALTTWRPGLISSGLKTGQLSGLWCVLNVMLRLCTTRPRRTATEQKQSRIRKVATLARSGEKGRALQPETPRQSQSQSRLFKRSRVSSRQTQNLSLLRRQLRQTFSCQKLPSSSPPHSARCHDSPGPFGMRAEHCYDFGAPGSNSNLFVQVVAHIAAASVPHTVLQYLKAGQITPLAKPTGGHGPLLIMSFLRRLALKSVMAAKKELAAKCAGPLQCGVGRPDGTNTMIKTIQYLAEADPSRVLVSLDLKAAFQNVSRRATLFNIQQNDTDLAAVFSKWYTGTTEHTTHHDSAKVKISANGGVDQGCPLSTCRFCAAIIPSYGLSCQTSADCMTQVPSSLPTWTTGTFGSSRSTCYKLLFSLQQPPDQSTLNYSPPKFSFGGPLVKTPSLLSHKTKSNSHSVVLEDIFRSAVTLNPAALFWANKPPWKKPRNASSGSPPRLLTSTQKHSTRRQ